MIFGNKNGKSASKIKFCTIGNAILTNEMVKRWEMTGRPSFRAAVYALSAKQREGMPQAEMA